MELARLVALSSLTSVALLACSGSDVGVFGESGSAASGATTSDGASGLTTTGEGAASSSGAGNGGADSVVSSGNGGASVTSGDGGGSVTSGDGGASVTSGDGGASVTSGTTSSSSVATSSVATSTGSGVTCGDGTANGSEACDGQDLDGQTCISLGFPSGGTLSCTDACAFDTSACDPCGNDVVDAGEDCDDGRTQSNDGCSSTCQYEGTTCDGAIVLDIDRGETITLTMTNEDGELADGACSNGQGAGRSIRFNPQGSGFLRAWIKRGATTFDSTLRMGYSCNETFVCADSYDPGGNGTQPSGGEVGSLFVNEGQSTNVIIEAWDQDAVGDFEVEVTLSRGRCDEPIVLPIEPGSNEGIVAWGFNAGQGNDGLGTCGGNGEDVTYRLNAVGNVDAVDLSMGVALGNTFNPVLHARAGACNDQEDEVACAGNTGVGQSEQILGLDLDGAPYVFADATQGSQGGYVLRVIPPAP